MIKKFQVCSCSEWMEYGVVMHVQREQAISFLRQYATWRCAVIIATCVTCVLVSTCTCTFAILLWTREQTSNSLSDSGNWQWRPLKCFSKPAAMKQWTGRGVLSGIHASRGADCHPPDSDSLSDWSSNATQNNLSSLWWQHSHLTFHAGLSIS